MHRVKLAAFLAGFFSISCVVTTEKISGESGTPGDAGPSGEDGVDGVSPFELVSGNACFPGGDLGVGTEAPNIMGASRAVTVSAGTADEHTVGLELQGSSSADKNFANIEFYNRDTRVASVQAVRDGSDGSASLRFFTAHNSTLGPHVVITSSGDVGVGTTTPISRFHVSGGYLQVPTTTTLPPAEDCDDVTEVGRIAVYSSTTPANDKSVAMFVCMNFDASSGPNSGVRWVSDSGLATIAKIAQACPDPDAPQKYGFCIWAHEDMKSYFDAAALCRDEGGRLCTRAEISAAQAAGAHWCVSAWIADRKDNATAYTAYPLQSPDPGCGSVGVVEYETPMIALRGANCCRP